MKSAFALAFAAVAAALPAPQAGTSEPLRFGGMALRSASPIHFGHINANGQRFVIGKNTTTYCPEDFDAGAACASANTNTTVFSYYNGQGTLSLSTLVPGGQQVYVTKGDEATGQLAGQLKFTEAHSATTSGPALTEGFTIVYDAKFQFEGQDWYACPLNSSKSGYDIWAASRIAGSQADEGCLNFNWKVVQLDDSTPSAWQYVK